MFCSLLLPNTPGTLCSLSAVVIVLCRREGSILHALVLQNFKKHLFASVLLQFRRRKLAAIVLQYFDQEVLIKLLLGRYMEHFHLVSHAEVGNIQSVGNSGCNSASRRSLSLISNCVLQHFAVFVKISKMMHFALSSQLLRVLLNSTNTRFIKLRNFQTVRCFMLIKVGAETLHTRTTDLGYVTLEGNYIVAPQTTIAEYSATMT